MREQIDAEMDKMLVAGVIERAASKWASPVVVAPKMDGTLRICVDYQRLNTKTLSETYLFRQIDDCIDSLGDAAVFLYLGL